MRKATPQAELLDAAFDVVRRLRDFDQYGRSDQRALAALRRRSGATPARCALAYRRASELYDGRSRSGELAGKGVDVVLASPPLTDRRPRFTIPQARDVPSSRI